MPFMSVAQDAEGKINGTVKDPDGAVVAGASVSLLHSHRAVIAATTTDAEGRFTLEHVSPGDYQLNVEGKGFVRYRSAVHVTAGQMEIRLAEAPEEVQAAQALRYRIFYE